ncbi:MAG: cellulose synthase family protein [Planctomycetota bacterium]|nr:cellulose synthase family protein [Planctomycetota bacterium]
MDALTSALLVLYIAVIVVFCVYGLHRYWLLAMFQRAGGLTGADPRHRFPALPPVTVQLPMFNEPRVAERIITAACALDYPRHLLQIQVLDDSTDGTVEIARACCRRLVRAGFDIQYVHRTDRAGYKAGALAHGLRSATGAFIAVFDADFVPPPDVLKRSIHHFTDDSVGMVQMRWEHLNREQSLLTRVQALCLDAHFAIEQAARARTGRWFNFNGTAGIWRRACIDDAGGWSHDTLTEDTDLSYRAQLAGWRFRYLPHVVCPAELPPTISALMGQQHRWNKGLIQTAMKLLPTILRSRARRGTKIEAFFHLTSPLPYAGLLLLTLLLAPAFLLAPAGDALGAELVPILGGLCIALGTLAACTFCIASQRALGRPLGPAVALLPAMMAIGIGLSVINTRAILEALLGHRSPFLRTPKFNGAHRSDADPQARAARVRLPAGMPEALLGALMVLCLGLSVARPAGYLALPFIFLFACGYLMIGLPQLRGALGRPPRPATRRAAEAR